MRSGGKERVKPEKSLDNPLREVEVCMNPWNGECRSTEIAVYIYHGGERLPVCRRCWIELADGDYEWGEWPGQPKPPGRR
ncbi:MAG: hypothetical protein DRJ69_00970 [Thermoprotei archaeon]|nr:MAG: hypothetical protein DRJ69_00970 [Thermoprotei archaeon]